jgi:hypothetical protein
MDLTEEIKHAVGVTASTMLAEELNHCDLALYENDYVLVVKGSPEISSYSETDGVDFPFGTKIFVLFRK